MRELYIEIMALICQYARQSGDVDGAAQLLVVINSGDAPGRDQDIVDALSELYRFIVFGENLECNGTIQSWGDARSTFEKLERHSNK